MDDLCILFQHHKNDDMTRLNYSSWCNQNPGVRVVALACDDGKECDPLPEATIVPCEFTRGFNSSNIDQVYSAWFRHDQTPAARYLLVESDSYCNVKVADYYAEYWNNDVVVSELITPQSMPTWWHFRDAWFALPWDWSQHVCAVVPINGTMLSHAAMSALAAEQIEGVWCELRMPTILRASGFEITPVSKEIRERNRWHRVNISRTPGIWHKTGGQ